MEVMLKAMIMGYSGQGDRTGNKCKHARECHRPSQTGTGQCTKTQLTRVTVQATGGTPKREETANWARKRELYIWVSDLSNFRWSTPPLPGGYEWRLPGFPCPNSLTHHSAALVKASPAPPPTPQPWLRQTAPQSCLTEHLGYFWLAAEAKRKPWVYL